MADLKKKTKGKTFGHIDAWEIVRQNDKWLEQPIVGQTSSSNSDKRKKSSESSNDNVETIIPDLNEDTTPTRKRRGKKSVSESSTSNSVAATFEIYASKKSQLFEESLEKKCAKDELAEKLMAAQVQGAQEKAFIRAFKFFNEPHNNIEDPDMREIAIQKKREFAAKYGWPCNF